MKKALALTMLSLLILVACNSKKEVEKELYRVASFNIRLDTPADGDNSWEYRKPHVFQFIRDNQLSLIGFQEVLNNQHNDLIENLPEYQFVGVGRNDGKKDGEAVSIAFLKEKFELIESNTFWLAPHPDSVGMVGWDAALPRIATWVKLKNRISGDVLMMVNTHFDHIGAEARRNSALLIIEKIKEIVGDLPAVITGDFNITAQDEAYETITTHSFKLIDSHIVAKERVGESYTFNNFGNMQSDADAGEKIDFIFVTPHFDVLKSAIPSSKIDDTLYLTDHNVLICDIAI